MKTRENGKTKDTSRRRKDGECKDEREGLGEYGQDSPVYGIKTIRTSSTNSPGENHSWIGNHQGNVSPGKILERLELIEKTFSSYVEGHQQRLETRLEESKLVQKVFKEEVQTLKQEIYRLTTKSDE